MKLTRKQPKYEALLTQNFLFSGTDPAFVHAAFSSDECVCMEFEPGEKIYTEHHFQKSMGIVLSGRLKACKPGEEGANLILNTFFPGGVFGVACLFNDTQQYVSEVAAEKRSRVMFLSQNLLHGLFQRDYRIAENYIGYLSNRICFLNSRIGNFTGGSAEYRLASYLVSLSEQSADPLRFELPCTLTRLAEVLDMGRASLYRVMDALADAGLLRRAGKTVELLDSDRLKSGQFKIG